MIESSLNDDLKFVEENKTQLGDALSREVALEVELGAILRSTDVAYGL